MSREIVAFIGANVRRRRKAANLTQTELAAKAKASRAHLSQLENGTAPGYPSLGSLISFATVLGCKVADLLYEPSCGTCLDAPPAGFTCNECGTGGAP
jgi:transcriptional regulator with XRE-family HTH domain